MKRPTTGPSSAFGALVLLMASAASAEPSAGQRAAAEALFEQGTKLVDAGRVAEGCEKLAASQELDPALGTQLYLADCYDRVGRTASAWALFREVQERSHRAAQSDRERIALERSSALEAKLSRLELRVPAAHQLPGLELSMGDAAVPQASWNVALPVDPGVIRVAARAPGRKPWSVQVTVKTGPSQQVIELPRLALAPVVEKPASLPAHAPGPEPSTLGTTGYVAAGAGLVALATGGFFGYRAYSFDKKSKGECRADSPNACTPEGARLREQATSSAQISTITALGGAVLLVGGVALVVATPSPASQQRDGTARASLAENDWRLELRGVW